MNRQILRMIWRTDEILAKHYSKRGRLEIYLDIIEAVRKSPQKPTRIMYKANLSWKPFMEILRSLQDQGLIDVAQTGNHTTLKITEKGKNVLKYFNEAMKLVEIR